MLNLLSISRHFWGSFWNINKLYYCRFFFYNKLYFKLSFEYFVAKKKHFVLLQNGGEHPEKGID